MSHLRNIKREARIALPSAGEVYTAEDGTESQVLDELPGPTLAPTAEEVARFAGKIGMHLPEEAELMWIAEEGLKTSLPQEWRRCRTSTGELYYFNFKTGDSTWVHPMEEMCRKKLEGARARAGRPPLTSATPARVVLTDTTTMTTTPSEAGRLVSEAEKALEERLRAELRARWEEEQAHARELHAAQLTALREQHARDTAELRAQDAARRAEAARAASAATETHRAEARRRCAELHGGELESLEQETTMLRAQLAKLDEEYARAGGEERAARARQAEETRTTRLRALEAEMTAQRDAALTRARERWETQTAAARTRSADAQQRIRAEAQRARHEQEVAAVRATEQERRALELEQRRLSAQLQTLTTTAAQPTSAEDAARAVQVRCSEVRARAAQTQAQLRRDKEAELAALRHQLASNVTGRNDDDASAALRARYARETQDALAALAAERQRRLDADDAPVAASCAQELQELQARHTAVQNELRAELAQETANTAPLDDAARASLVNTVLELDMAAYVHEVEARRRRLAAEAAAKRAVSVRRAQERQAQHAREHATLLAQRVSDAVAQERTRLQAECDAQLAQFAQRAEDETRAVEQEMTAYAAAARQQRGRASEEHNTRMATLRAELTSLRDTATRLRGQLDAVAARRSNEDVSATCPTTESGPHDDDDAALRDELQRWRVINESLTARLRRAPSPTQDDTAAGTVRPGSFSTEDAIQYCTTQQTERARRQRCLRAARSLWQSESAPLECSTGGADAVWGSAETSAGADGQPWATLLQRVCAQLDQLTRHVVQLREQRGQDARAAVQRVESAAKGRATHVDPTRRDGSHATSQDCPEGVLARKWRGILSDLHDTESGPTWAVYT